MLSQIIKIVAEQFQIQKGRPLLLAVSGGPDSLFLLDVFRQLDFPLIIAYFDHRFRPESRIEGQVLAALAAELGIPFCQGSADVALFAHSHRLSLEAAGRQLRYEFLFEQAGIHGAQAVVTGHTADDQVETILLHLLRGSGILGLRGMQFQSLPNAWSREIPLLRPLLTIWRTQIDAYNQEKQLKPFEDSSNSDIRFSRNRLRHKVLPELENLSPDFKQHLWLSNQNSRDDFVIIEQTIQSAWEDCINTANNSWVSFDRSSMGKISPALQRHLIRRAAMLLLPEVDNLDTPGLERARKFIGNPPKSHQMDWFAGMRIKIEANKIWITHWDTVLPDEELVQFPQAEPGPPISIPIPGKMELNNQWELSIELIPPAAWTLTQASANADPYQAWIDLQTVPDGLQVRQRLPGDRIQPLGMNRHSMKVSDMMTNDKIPTRARSAWPIIVSGSSIVWIPGLRLGDQYCLQPASSSALVIKLIRSK